MPLLVNGERIDPGRPPAAMIRAYPHLEVRGGSAGTPGPGGAGGGEHPGLSSALRGRPLRGPSAEGAAGWGGAGAAKSQGLAQN